MFFRKFPDYPLDMNHFYKIKTTNQAKEDLKNHKLFQIPPGFFR